MNEKKCCGECEKCEEYIQEVGVCAIEEGMEGVPLWFVHKQTHYADGTLVPSDTVSWKSIEAEWELYKTGGE